MRTKSNFCSILSSGTASRRFPAVFLDEVKFIALRLAGVVDVPVTCSIICKTSVRFHRTRRGILFAGRKRVYLLDILLDGILKPGHV